MVEVKHLPIILFIVISIAFFFLAPITYYGDAYGHMYKIYRICKSFVRWDNNWYLGYPYLVFYSPLVYLISRAFCFLDPLIIYKLIGSISLFLSFLISYYLGLKISNSVKKSLILSFFFTMNPLYLRFYGLEGNLPMFFAYPLLLVFFYLFYNFEKLSFKEKTLLAFISFLILISHLSTFVLSVLLALVILVKKFRVFKDKIADLLYVSFLFLSISLWFILPFIYLRNYTFFLKFNEDPSVLNLLSANPIDVLIFPESNWTNYLSILPILLINLEVFSISNLTFLLLSFGKIFKPIFLLNIPIISSLPPYRYLILVIILTWYLLLKRDLKPYYYPFLISVILFSILPLKVTSSIDSSMTLLKDLDGRIWFPDESPYYSYISYLPSKGVKVFNGWYREANPIFWYYSELRNDFLKGKINSTLLNVYGIKYIAVNKRRINLIRKLEKIYEKKMELKYYVVFENRNSSFVCCNIRYRIINYSNSYIKLEVQGSKFTVALAYFPTWKVYVNGSKYNPEEKYGVFYFDLPEGSWTIEFKYYDPLSSYER